MTATGGQSQPVPHPCLRIAREAELDSAQYARDLLLTPRSRRAAGLLKTPRSRSGGKLVALPLPDEVERALGER